MAQFTSVTDRPGLAEEQAALRRVATLVAQQPSPQEVFDAVTEAVGPLLGADLAFLHLFPGDGTSATIAGWSATSEMLPIGTRLPLDGDSVAARIFHSGSAARIDGYEGVAGEVAELARGMRIRSTVGAPILVSGRLWGALIAATREDHPLPEDAERRIAAFTGLVATAIANAEARRELEEVAAEQRALRRAATLVAAGASATEVFAAITSSAAEVFGVPFSSLIRVDPDERATMVAGCAACGAYVGTTWEVPPNDTGIARAVLNCRRPSRIEDHSRVHGPIGEAARALGVGSVVGAPVFVGGSVWGVMVVGAQQDGPPLPIDAGERLIGFTELVSTAIANSDSKERVDLLLNEQAALRRVAMLVAAEADADELFSAVSEEVAELLGSGGAAVGRFEAEGPTVIPVGVSQMLKSIPVGMRIDLDDSLACTSVYRTGRTARKDARGDDVYAVGPIGEMLQALGLYSSVAAPIKVAGRLWGTLITLSAEMSLPPGTEERLEKFSELVATAIANAESRNNLAAAESQARGLAEEQAALRRVATLVAQGVSPDKLFAAVSTEVASLFSAEVATIGRFEPTEPVEVTAVGVSQGPNDFLIGVRSPLMEWLASTAVFRTGRTARKDVTADEIIGEGTLADAIRAMGFFSTVSAPIIVEGQLWGVLTASSSEEPLPSGTEERLESFSELVATAIANAQGRGELAASEARARDLANEQAALRRVATLVAEGAPPDRFFAAVAREVVGVLDVAGVIVTHYESDGMAVVFGEEFGPELPQAEAFFGVGSRAPSDPGSLAAQVAETHSTARIDDFATLVGTVGDLARQAGFGSGCAGPIMVNAELWGKICVFSEAGRLLPVHTEGRLHDFIELTATAIASYEARSELAASEARARELAEEQAGLRRVATLVAQGVSSGELFSAVSEEVERLFRLDGGSAAAADVIKFEGEESVIVGASRGQKSAPVGSRFGPEDVYSSTRVLRTGRSARVSSRDLASGRGPDAEFLSRVGYLSQVASPILVEGRMWGVITMNAEEELPAGTEERLKKFTDLVATAIANAESRAELASSEARARELAGEQAALRRVATIVAEGATPEEVFDALRREVTNAFGVPFTVLYRYESDGLATVLATDRDYLGPTGTTWPIEGDTSVPARVWQTGGAARVDFTTRDHARGSVAEAAQRAGVRSGVGAPIIVQGELWGAMAVGSESDEPLPADLEARLERFTELLATAISNADSRAELATSEARARELATEQAALRRVAVQVAEGASPDELFSAVAEEVAGVIDIPVVGVSRYEADGTFTVLGTAGETSFTVGSSWPVEEDEVAGMILATGRPSRKDESASIPGSLGKAVSEDSVVSTVAVPIVVGGSIWGFMAGAGRPGWPIPPDAEERLARFTELVATAVSNATTHAELLDSRARVVNAGDETRRRLERDLHDGIQQWLVALALRARKAAGLSAAGEPADEELSGLADDLVAVTDELREISRGIHPAILSDAGLDDALHALARRSALGVDLDVDFPGRYDPTIEATVYYVTAESITNAVKHAQASAVEVRGGERDGKLVLDIRDNGVGGADPRRGSGMIGLKDRVDTLGGTITFASPAGAGTAVHLSLPAVPQSEEQELVGGSDGAAAAPASG